MTTQLTAEQILNNVVGLGRADVRIVESTEYILERKPPFFERMTLRPVVTVCRHTTMNILMR